MRRLLSTAALIGVFAILAGCMNTTGPSLKVDVPYVEQSPFECGVATMQMAFKRQGIPYDPVHLRKRVFIPALNGTTIGVMAKVAEEFGAEADVGVGNNHLLANSLKQGYSPIVLWGPKKKDDEIGHFLVVTAITASHDKLRVHSGLSADKWVPFREFMSRWEEGGNRILLIGRPGIAPDQVVAKPLPR